MEITEPVKELDLAPKYVYECVVSKYKHPILNMTYVIEIATSDGPVRDKVSIPFSVLSAYDDLEQYVGDKIFDKMRYMLGYSEYSAGKAFQKAFGKKHRYAHEMGNTVADIAKDLPGMDYQTECPACMSEAAWGVMVGPLYLVIQHLNDSHPWSRDRIADWLDKLHDDGKVDLSFDVKDHDGKEQP